MNVAPMPDGLPHEHLGMSHVCKHYLNPAEVWEDLAAWVEPELRPLALIARLGAPMRVPEEQDFVPKWAEPHRELLGAVNRRGYTVAVNALLEERTEPPTLGWFASDDDFIGTPGRGVLVIVKCWRARWELVTAYRALRYHFATPPPDDPYSRKNRNTLAEKRALRKLLGKVAPR